MAAVAPHVLGGQAAQLHGEGVRDKHMEWTKPEFIEVSMDAEISRYQQDDNGL